MLKNNANRPRFRQRILSRNAPRTPETPHITLSFETVQKIVELLLQSVSPFQPASGQEETRLRSTMKPWAAVIDQILKEDVGVPKKLRTSAMRIFRKLRQEHGYPGCYNTVQEYVHEARTANHDPKSDRKSRKKKPRIDPAKPVKKAALPPAPAPHEELATLKALPSSSYTRSLRHHPAKLLLSDYRLSQRPHRLREPEGHAFEWMRAVQQGAMGKLPIRNIDEKSKKDSGLYKSIVKHVKVLVSVKARLNALKGESQRVRYARQVARLETAINELVYRLYDVSEAEAAAIQRELASVREANESQKPAQEEIEWDE